MIEIKNVKPGDKVRLETKSREWVGHILESYDAEIILIKLETGYNIGVRHSEILKVEVLEKIKKEKEEKINLEKKEGLRNVAMIVTGGTISSRLDTKTGGVKWTTVDDLFKIAPELSSVCNITEIKTPFMQGSEDMSLKYWKKIAETAHELLLDEKVDGIIVTHGTDVLHYGGAALSFFIQDLNKPIAFTYSQRSIDRASTDAHLNLICAARYAVSDIAEVAIVGHKDLNDKECLAIPAVKCRKMHASRRDTFRPINTEPLAVVSKEHLEILKEFRARGNSKPKLDTKYNEKVALVKFVPGMDPGVLEYYSKEGYKGIVIEVTGLGHVAAKASDNNWLPTIKRLVDKGMIICAAPQTIYGSLNTKVYSNGRDLEKTGIVVLGDMLPETAYVKLAWVLGHKAWVYNDKSAPQKMLKNFVGEINEKIRFDDFNC